MNKKSQAHRSANADKFVKLRDGVWGGFKRGVQNGPAPSRKARGPKKAFVKNG